MKKLYDRNKKDGILRVAFGGGGSGGPVMPLFVLAKELRIKHPNAEFLLIGTDQGPERKMAEWNNIPFVKISAGKLRRYFSLKTLTAPFQSLSGFFQARRLLKKFKANVFVAAGGFVSVPAGYAAWSLGIPVLIHQQDLIPSVSNKLLAPVASAITVTFKKSLKDFNAQSGFGLPLQNPEEVYKPERCIWTGNPVRPEFAEYALRVKENPDYNKELRTKFGISSEDWPVLLIVGGGTGAIGLNSIVQESLPQLLQRFEIIHGSGGGKQIDYNHSRYHQFELITEMPEAFAIASLIICRAGIGTITELSAAKKPAIVVPMPDSHQEENALYLHDKQAAMIYAQDLLDGQRFVAIASSLLYDQEQQEYISKNISEIMPQNSAQKIIERILKLSGVKND